MKRILLCLILSVTLARSQDSLTVTDGFHVKPGMGPRKIASTVAIGTLFGLSIYWCYDSWWRGSHQPFTIIAQDWLDGYARGIDKVGHFYTSYFYFNLFRNIMLWGGYEDNTASMWAMGGTALFALVVELGDGFAPYGFDYQDLTFNLGGVAYGYLQTKIPFLKNFNFKWIYAPREGYHFPVRLVEHYDDHTYWLTCNVNNLLPDALEPYWPDFLQIGVGMGVDDHQTRREFLIGIDLDLESIFRTDNEDWLLLEKTVNKFHVPGPAIKFTETKKPLYYLLQLH
jgi:Predicted periplasmic lipoprotein (DUF2279)